MSLNKTSAQQVLELLGGKSNIVSNTTCMTRLHIRVNDQQLVKLSEIKKVEGVLGLVDGEVIQIVFGPGKVQRVGDEFARLTGIALGGDDINLKDLASQKKKTLVAKQTNPVQVFFKHFANIFLPLLPGIAAAGLINGISKVINLETGNAFVGVWWYAAITTVGWALFLYLPIFVGMNAAREFKGSAVLGGIVGAFFVSQGTMPLLAVISEAKIMLPITSAQFNPAAGGILAAVFAGIFIAYAERTIRKFVPDVLDMFLTPLIALLITTFAILFVIQPFGAFLTTGIFDIADFLLNRMGLIGSFFLSVLQLPLVSLGLHRAFTPIHALMNNPEGPTLGINYLLPILQVAGAGQVGAALALFVKARKDNKRLAKAIGASLPAGILGIGEPLMYGVTLPLVKPFITACIGSGLGGIVMNVMNVGAMSQGVSGLLGFLIIQPGGQFGYLIAFLVAYVSGYLLTFYFGYDKDKVNEIYGYDE